MKASAKRHSFAPVLAAFAACLAFLSAQAADFTENPGQLSSADYKFAKAAAQGSVTEVILGKMAADKSTNATVQEFGRRMVKDHGKVGENLRGIASAKGATLPTEPGAAQQKEIERLGRLAGGEFDKAYVKAMVAAHKADEREFRRSAKKVEDNDLKVFATETLPIIQEHLKMARDLDETVKSELSSNN